MPNNSTTLLRSIRWSLAYIIAIPVIVCILMLWVSSERIRHYEENQLSIAESAVNVIAIEVGNTILNYQRLVSAFADSETKLISALASDPENDALKTELGTRIRHYFPEYFAFTLADDHGEPRLEDFDGYIGETCLADMKQLASGTTPQVQIHPSPYVYHFDIMTHWQHNGAGGIFFISFKTDVISRLLSFSNPYKLEMYLVNTRIENLIEITEAGSRIKLNRTNLFLTDSEQERLLYSAPVENTHWRLVALRNESLFSHSQHSIYTYSIVTISIFLAGSLIMVIIVLRAEKHRRQAALFKEEMFSLFNHELRNPLNAIHSVLSVLSVKNLAEKPEHYNKLATSARSSSEFMIGLVNDILELQKMEFGKMDFNFELTDVNRLSVDAVNMCRSLGSDRSIELELIELKEPLQMRIDTRRILQVITNLISNAVKYSPAEETVKVKLEKDADFLRIYVSDNGPGIPKDFQPYVFDKFAQSSSELTKKVGGTGLGLAVVRYIVNEHQGKVFFETSAETGTTFIVELPLTPSQ